MSEAKNSVHKQISDLDETFGQITSRTNISNCANQDADLSEDGINDDCGCSRKAAKPAAEIQADKTANAEITELDQSFGEIAPLTNEHPYADQDAEYDEDGIDNDALIQTREKEEGEPLSAKEQVRQQISDLNESFGQITSQTNISNCANQDADLSEDGITDECGCGCKR